MPTPPTAQSPKADGRSGRSKLVHRLLLVATGFLVAALVADHLRWRDFRDEHVLRISAAGPKVATPTSLRRVQRERTPIHARVTATRALVYGSIQADSEGILPLEERQRRLAEAQSLARQNLSENPVGWESWMLLGTAIYSERALGNDRRLITESKDWENPLLRAVETGAGRIEAQRMLAAPYLETWAYLSPEKKERTRTLLTEVFRSDPEALERLAPLWLLHNGTREEALSIFPPHPRAWRFLEGYFLERRQFPALIRAHEHHWDALESSLALDLEQARLRLDLGDPNASRQLGLSMLLATPRERRFLALAEATLGLQPIGIHGRVASDTLALWLDYLLTLDLYGLYDEALSPVAVARLLDAVEGLDEPEQAHGALLAEEFFTVRELEAEIPARASSPWLPFLLSRARHALAAGDLEEARTLLGRVDLLSRDGLPYRLVEAEVKQAAGESPRLATQGLDEHRKTRWSVFDWSEGKVGPRVGLLPASRARGLRIEIVYVERDGDVIDVLWDGARIGSEIVRPRSQLEIELPIEPSVHLLELRSLRGERIAPGRVELIP